MDIDAQIAYITNGYGKVQHLEVIDVDMGNKEMSSYSIDYSANGIVNTTTNAKWDQTDGKDHPDYGIPPYISPDDKDHLGYGIPLHISQNEPIVITSEAVFIKPLKLVVITEDVYNKLKGEENEMR